jgi:hypothetical protein
MKHAPRGNRLHIALFGRRNVGKSSLLNLTRQAAAIVSDVAGTTTDPVEKPMELLPIGPVLFIDTAGHRRRRCARRAARREDAAGDRPHRRGDAGGRRGRAWGDFEDGSLAELRSARRRSIVVFNKSRPRARRDDALIGKLKREGPRSRRPRHGAGIVTSCARR